MGDFNAGWDTDDGSHPPLYNWASAILLQHVALSLGQQLQPTFFAQGKGVSTIDHILSAGSHLCPHSYTILDAPHWRFSLDDHRPLLAVFRIPSLQAPYRSRRLRSRPPALPRDIARPSKCSSPHLQRRLGQFQTRVSAALSPTPPISTVRTAQQFLKKLSLACPRAITWSRPRARGPHGWSPEVVALTTAKAILIEISRRLLGQRSRRRWQSRHVLHSVRSLCARWRSSLRRLARDDSQLQHLLTLTPYGPDYWSSHPSAITPHRLHAEIKSLGKLLHGRHRKDLRDLLAQKARFRRLLRSAGKHLSETRLLLDRATPYFALDELLLPDGTITTDQRLITQLATEFFRVWHAPKPHLTFGFHDPSLAPSLLLESCDLFIRKHSPTGVPAPLLRTIWQSLTTPLPTTAAFLEDQRELGRSPTFDE